MLRMSSAKRTFTLFLRWQRKYFETNQYYLLIVDVKTAENGLTLIFMMAAFACFPAERKQTLTASQNEKRTVSPRDSLQFTAMISRIHVQD
jgi:hypothetical protein